MGKISSRETNTYLALASRKLGALCAALDIDAKRRDELEAIIERCMAPWGERLVGSAPEFLSDITDDHTPFEFSVAFRGDAVDMRLLVEAQPSTPRIDSRWAAGMDLIQALERDDGCSLDRFRAIEEVFRPTDQWARFAMWHAVNVGQRASFKVYLNPAAHGAHRASATVKSALERLGMLASWSAVPQLRRGFDEVKYFALDLTQGDAARVKIYFSHRNAPLETIEDVLSRAPGYTRGAATEFCRALSGGLEVFDVLPVQTCYSFAAGSDQPEDVALHFPVRSYAQNDAEALARVSWLLGEARGRRYREIVEAYAGCDLAGAHGVQTYASFWAKRGRDQVTVYLSPQLYGANAAQGASS